jgi:F-type H+-transporting ATPase subunit delta
MPQPERVSPKHENVMDVTVEQLARVYAKAFMGVAAKTSSSEALVEELKSIVADVLDRFPKLEEVFKSSLISPEEKEALLDRVFSKGASVHVTNFLKVLARHGRLEVLRSISRQAEKLFTEQSGVADVDVRVAAKLDDDIRKVIETRVEKAIGKKPRCNVTVDPNLIAGIVVRVGDRVFDGSLKTHLENARRAMIDRATDQLETRPDRFFSAS